LGRGVERAGGNPLKFRNILRLVGQRRLHGVQRAARAELLVVVAALAGLESKREFEAGTAGRDDGFASSFLDAVDRKRALVLDDPTGRQRALDGRGRRSDEPRGLDRAHRIDGERAAT